jgi:Uma2 family endonuclease
MAKLARTFTARTRVRMTRMAIGSRVTTAEELIRLPRGRWRYELVDGVLRQMTPAGHLHGKIAAEILVHLATHVRAHGLGQTYAAETGFVLRRSPDTVRAPDASFVAAARLESMDLSPDGYFPGPPDVAIEVFSPGDSYREFEAKTADWLASGCKVVVLIDPARECASVHRAGDPVVTLSSGDTLQLPDLLPGWSVEIEDLFR